MTSNPRLVVWASVGAALWSVQLLAGYVLATTLGGTRAKISAIGLSAVCALVAAIAAAVAGRRLGTLASARTGDPAPDATRRFLLLTATLLNGFFAIVIAAHAFAPLFLRPGD